MMVIGHFLFAAIFLLVSPQKPAHVGIGNAPAAEEEIWRSFNRLRMEFQVPQAQKITVLDDWARLNSRARAIALIPGQKPPRFNGLEEAAAAGGLFFTATKSILLDLPSLDLTLIREFLLNESSVSGRRLWPELDAGGIGVVEDERGHLMATVVLLHSLAPRSAADWRGILGARIDADRKSKNWKPLSWKRQFHEIAQEIAEGRRSSKQAAEDLGQTRLVACVLFTTIDPSGPEFRSPEFEDPLLRYAGLGVWFGRTVEYPGGCYRLAVLLAGIKEGIPLR